MAKRAQHRKKLTSHLVAMVVEAIDKGLVQWVDIAQAAEVSSGQLRVWRRLGEKGPKDDPDYSTAALLVRQIAAARANRRERYLREMEKAGGDDWRMWKALLDRDEKVRLLEDDEPPGERGGVTVDVAGADGNTIAIVRVQPGLVEALTGDEDNGE